MLQLFSIFHLNIAYSSIEEAQRPEVLRRCYWPLLRLAERTGAPIGIEATGFTLETVAAIDPQWVDALKVLVAGGQCEFVGSGYAQIIGPLVPAAVNAANLRLGHQVYQRLLGFRPRLAFVNEQAYAAGLIQHYLDAGYQRLFNLQAGNTGLAIAPWSATDTERFWNAGVGGRWVPQERWTVTVDYLLAPSYGDINSVAGGLAQAFPQNYSKLNTTRLEISYRWTPATQIRFRYTRETYHSSDWALGGVGPSTVPNLLALGIDPYRDNVNLFGLTIRYQFGRDTAVAHASP